MGRRRQARELALQFLYGFDVNRRELAEALNDFWAGQRVPEETKAFARRLIIGTIENADYLDGVIRGHARNWRLGRIALVDKNILRLALYEIYFCDDIPSLVSINEAVDIAKKFSTSKSGSFVNGILDKVREEIEVKGTLKDKDVEAKGR